MQQNQDYKAFIQAFETYRKAHPEYGFQKSFENFFKEQKAKTKSTARV